MKKIILSTCILVLASAGSAVAGDCTGTNARNSAKPVTVHKVKDGPVTMLVASTGTSMTLTPADQERQAWQHCSGMWVAQPDGSGSGQGHCYSVDGDGDMWTISWEGADGKGTWAHVHGTGKYDGRTSKGTWASGKRFPGGLSLSHWEGTCG